MKAELIGKHEDSPGDSPPGPKVEEEKPALETEQDVKKAARTKEEDKASLKLEEHKDSLKSEENKDSLKLEENKDAIKAELGPGALRRASGQCAGNSADVPEDIKFGVKEEDKFQVKAQIVELADAMDIDRPATAEMDDGPSDLGRVSSVAATPPSEVVPQMDDSQVLSTAEDSPLSEVISRAVSLAETVATTALEQVIVKEEPIDMDIDTVANSAVEQADVAREHDSTAEDEIEGMDVDEEATTTETSRPAKRRKVFMDAVILPFVSSIRAHADAERQAIERQLEQLRNPNVKKPKDTPILSLDTVRSRLHAHNISYVPYPVDLAKDILDVTVTREFMSSAYGGSPQKTFPEISAKFYRKTGLRNFTYLNLLLNPQCPEIPGAPGLIFGGDLPLDIPVKEGVKSDKYDSMNIEESGDEGEGYSGNEEGTGDDKDLNNQQDEDSEQKTDKVKDTQLILFARLGQNEWQYQGQYITAEAEDLTVEEWKQQSPMVRKCWASQLSFRPWGLHIRADIVLRRELGRKPTAKELKAALDTKDNFFTVTAEEISNAFDRGEAVIAVETMKCVGYNVDLQRNLAAKFPLFVPKPKNREKERNPPRRPTKRGAVTAATAPRVRKRKRQDADEEEFEDYDYRPRGTRSRPIVL